MEFGSPLQQPRAGESSSNSENRRQIKKCCIPGCSSTTANFNLFKIPKTLVAKKWYRSIKESFRLESLDDVFLKLRINKNALLCELHFATDCFSEHWMSVDRVCLKRSAVPSVFSATEIKLKALAGEVGLEGRVYNLNDESGHVGAVKTIVNNKASVLAPLAPLLGMQCVGEHSYAKKIMQASEAEAQILEDLKPEVLMTTPLGSTFCSGEDGVSTVGPMDESWQANESLLNDSSSSDESQYDGREKQPQFFLKTSKLLSTLSHKSCLVKIRKLRELFPSNCTNCLGEVAFNINTAFGSGIIIRAQCFEKKSVMCYERTWCPRSMVSALLSELPN